MIIGVPREIVDQEYRVALTPQGAHELAHEGHKVLVERGAGEGSSISDHEYREAGAAVVAGAAEVYGESELILKVKEPQESEYPYLRENQVLFAFLHLAANRELTEELLRRKVVGVAYETVQRDDGSLPLLAPMSEVAGRMAPQVGAHYLEKMNGGRGLLLGGATGVPPATVVILGAGIVGSHSAILATGMDAHVMVLDKSVIKLRYLEHILHGRITTLISNKMNVREAVRGADLVIGAVLVPGARCPILVGEETVRDMRPGSVVVDVSIDQGGCVMTSRPTTHSNPVYEVHGVLHYCVGNMPGAVPHTSTFALTNVTLPYVQMIASLGLAEAVRRDKSLARGVNTIEGRVTSRPVAEAHSLDYEPLEYILPLELPEAGYQGFLRSP
ncbi:alanine dehydrogenase [Candidatus Solincola tengchongensis]|uniref:alanine dehydrogenase n=1 Tax=Candidatus Solincola tengchongensis TaxID=2900693 RepID=UPI00257C5334